MGFPIEWSKVPSLVASLPAAQGSATMRRPPVCARATRDNEDTGPRRVVPRAEEGTSKWETDLRNGEKSDEMQLEMDEDESKQLKL